MNPDRGVADRISDHLDAIVTGADTRTGGLDPTLAATVEQFFAVDDAPAPPPGLAERLWVELLQDTAPMPIVPPSLAPRPGRKAHPLLESTLAPLPQREPSSLRWALTHLATAALVLLTLIGAFVLIRGSVRLIGQDDRPASIPAIDESLEVVTVVEALITTWPADGPPFWASLQRITLDPGAVEEIYAVDATGVGPDLFTVESGQIAVDADGPVVVTRGPAGRRAEPTSAPAGTTIVLDEGDHLFVPSNVTFRRRNTTTDPAGVLDFQIASVEPMHQSVGVRYDRLMPDKILNTPPPAPARAALHRLRLLPGTRLPIGDLPGLHMLFVEEGALELMGARAPGDLAPVSWATIPAGRGMAHFDTTPELANRSAEPVTFLVATIDPSD